MSVNGNPPAGTADYVYPGVIEKREKAAIERAKSDARQGNIQNPVVRDILPATDLDAGDDADWSPDRNRWYQTPDVDSPSDGAWDTGTYQVYEIDSDTGRGDDRVITIYGFEAIEGAEYVETVLFRGSDGQVFERAKVEGLTSDGDTEVDRQKILRSPVSFAAQDNATIELELANSTNTEDIVRVKFLGVTAEKQGRTLGNRA